jgi:hypothetical protein
MRAVLLAAKMHIRTFSLGLRNAVQSTLHHSVIHHRHHRRPSKKGEDGSLGTVRWRLGDTGPTLPQRGCQS